MYTRSLCYTLIPGLLVSQLYIPQHPSPEQGEVEAIASTVQVQTPDYLQVTQLEPTFQNDLEISYGNDEVLIPLDVTEKIVFKAPESFNTRDFELEIALDEKLSSSGKLANDGSVVFTGKHFSQTVITTTEGVRINSVLENDSSPERIEHDLTLPNGSRLVTVEELRELRSDTIPSSEDGKLFIIDENNDVLVAVSAPWAFDASGHPVETFYSVEDSKLVQTILHNKKSYDYPIVADPLFGYDMIAWAFWKLQYACHQRFAYAKDYWNLDEWRPAVTYAATVAAKCNP